MTEFLIKQFSDENYNAEKFVKELSAQCIGAEELRHQRAKVQELADNTSAMLKLNVYQNYIQFIETAKEISHLESEMYQLSQLLSEQRSLLSILSINNHNGGLMFEDTSESELETIYNSKSKEDDSKQKLIELLENVEGALNLIDIPGRICLYNGSLLEIDMLEGTPLRRVHAYLFNDILMIASWLSNGSRRGSPRYRVHTVYDLQNVAVVNVRDLGNVKFAFKLLAFPDARVFQCPTAINKKEWLEKCDQAKKIKIFHEKSESVFVEKPVTSVKLISTSPLISSENNPGILPEWILEAPEDLDSCIAQRRFEEAYKLLDKTEEYLRNIESNYQLNEMKIKLSNRIKFLINVLTNELESRTEAKSLQGSGLRSARRAVRFLIQLGNCTHACQLFLKLCSVALKARLSRVKREGATVPYIKQLNAIAFSNLAEMSREFCKIFPHTVDCKSALLSWCSQEFKNLVSHLIKQIFIPQITLNVLVECIIIIRDHFEQFTQIGIDFRYQFDSQIRSNLIKALQDAGEKCIDAIKIRSTEDCWRPSNLQTIYNLRKLLFEFDELGIPIPKSCINNHFWVTLTTSTLTFSKLYIGLLEDCLNVTTPEIISTIEGVLIAILEIQVQHLQLSLLNPQLEHERKLMLDNLTYTNDVIIGRSLDLYESVTGYQFNKLLTLQQNFCLNSTSIINKATITSRKSVPKYSTTEFI